MARGDRLAVWSYSVRINKEKKIGPSFHAHTKFRRGQVQGVSGQGTAAFKVYANPLETVSLPVPDLVDGKGLWASLAASREQISEGGILRQPQASQILWAAAGFTFGRQRTHISATRVSTIETYLVANNVEDMFSGIYHYNPREHTLEYVRGCDPSGPLGEALLSKGEIEANPAAVVFTGVPGRLEIGAKSRAYRYVYQEAGAAAQAAALAAGAIDLIATFEVAFYDDELSSLLQIDGVNEVPLCIVLLGT